MSKRFEQDLEMLNTQMIEMGMLIETSIQNCAKALMDQDEELAKQTIEFDTEINLKEKQIESNCLRLLLQQHPVARDLRLISAALKMITDMERIGDQAADISELSIRLANATYIKKLEHIPMMAEATIKMVKDSIDAFVNRDLNLAEVVIKHDDIVDDLFNNIKDDLIIMIRQDVKHSEQAIDLIMIAKYFERIGDHAVNIAEWVIFSINGQHKNYNIL